MNIAHTLNGLLPIIPTYFTLTTTCTGANSFVATSEMERIVLAAIAVDMGMMSCGSAP